MYVLSSLNVAVMPRNYESLINITVKIMSNTLVDNLINETIFPETPAHQSTSMRLPKQTCSVKTGRLGIQESFVSTQKEARNQNRIVMYSHGFSFAEPPHECVNI